MTSKDFQNLLDRYSKGECTPAEEKLILNWYEQIRIDKSEEPGEDDPKIAEEKIWLKLKAGMSPSPRFSFSITRIAAAIALLIIAGAATYFLLPDPVSSGVQHQQADTQHTPVNVHGLQTIVNTSAASRDIKLKDGSQVTLKPGSKIHFPETFSDKREVYLSGEAFFNVTRDTLRPFLVYSGEVITRVLGTSFNIKAYEREKEVTVAVRTGKVSVYTLTSAGNTGNDNSNTATDPGKEVVLAPNQQAVYRRDVDQVLKQLVEKPEIILPKPTLFQMQYDGAPVLKIFKVLEENYGVDIVYDETALAGCTLTTSLADEGLYERIKIICEAIGAEYEVLGTSIVVTGNGCN